MDELAGLPESVQKAALDRFRLLQPYLEQSRPLRLVAIEAGTPYRTARRWVPRYQQFGLVALARKRRADTGAHRAESGKIREAIEGLARIEDGGRALSPSATLTRGMHPSPVVSSSKRAELT